MRNVDKRQSWHLSDQGWVIDFDRAASAISGTVSVAAGNGNNRRGLDTFPRNLREGKDSARGDLDDPGHQALSEEGREVAILVHAEHDVVGLRLSRPLRDNLFGQAVE